MIWFVRGAVVVSLIVALSYPPIYGWINSDPLHLIAFIVVYAFVMVRLFPGFEDVETLHHITWSDIKRWSRKSNDERDENDRR